MLLRYSADRRSLAAILLYFGFLSFAYSLPLSWWTAPLLVMIISLFSFLCAVITHNTIHAPMFWSKRLNRLMQLVLTLTYGHPVSAFVPGHNLSHHRGTQSRRDLMRTSKVNFRWNLLNQFFFAWTVGPPIFKANLRFAKVMREAKPKWFSQLMLETFVYLAMIVVTFVIDWQKALLFVVIPHQYAAWGIMGINFVQHDGCEANSKWNHSRNFTDPMLNWVTFNNGFHGMHHMKPSLHWSLLPEAHATYLAPNIHPELDQSNFSRYLFRAFIYPGKRTDADGRPYIPPPAGDDEEWIPALTKLTSDDLGAAS